MSLIDTLMQSIRSEYAGNLDRHEMRQSRYGVYDLFKRQTTSPASILSPDLVEKIKKSFGNTVTVPVMLDDDVAISNVRRCTIQDAENDSALVTLTFATYAFGFTMTPGQHFNNDIGYQADFNHKFRKYLLKFASTLDSACIAKLAADKNIYWPADVTNIYSQSGNALQVAQADRNDLYNQLSAIMETLDFYGEYDVAANTVHKPLVQRLINQGNANDENDAFQFQGYKWAYSNRITNGANKESTIYLMPQGSVAIENRNDPDAIMGSSVGDFKRWEEVMVPLVDLKMGAYYHKDCADRSALHAGATGLTRTLVEGFEWSTDICLVTAYNSSPSTKASPIVKVEVATT